MRLFEACKAPEMACFDMPVVLLVTPTPYLKEVAHKKNSFKEDLCKSFPKIGAERVCKPDDGTSGLHRVMVIKSSIS